jgi:hypothetical protein
MAERRKRRCSCRWGALVLLQKDNREDIMDTGLGGGGGVPETVGHRPHFFNHLERTIETWRELGLGTVSDPSCRPLMVAKPNPVIYLKCQITMELVMGSFHIILSLKQSFSNFLQELVTVFELPVNRDHLG